MSLFHPLLPDINIRILGQAAQGGAGVFFDKAEIWISSKQFIKLRLGSTGRLLKFKVRIPCISPGGLDTL